MTRSVLNEITQMRMDGKKPREISDALGISINTVKSHIRRHPLAESKVLCLNCGKPVAQNEGRKMKKFCCDRCRSNWWNRRYRNGGKASDKLG